MFCYINKVTIFGKKYIFNFNISICVELYVHLI